mgnify:FL=1
MDSNRNVSKVIQYDLEQDTVNLRQAGLSYQRIADELNASGKVPEDDQINADIVKRFLNHVPAVSREMVKRDKKRMMAVVDNNIDIIHEMTTLYSKTSDLLNAMESQAREKNSILDPHKFKALSSEMREMLKMMIEIQKELNDYENTKRFMEIVMETVAEECPQSIPIIIEKLKMSQKTQWIGQLFNERM